MHFRVKSCLYHCFLFLSLFFFTSLSITGLANPIKACSETEPLEFTLQSCEKEFGIYVLRERGFLPYGGVTRHGWRLDDSHSLKEDKGLLPETLAENAVLALYQFDFKEAERLNYFLKKNHAQTNFSHFSNVHYYWWLMISLPNSNRIGKLYTESIKQALPIAHKTIENNPSDQDTFFYIYLYAMQARLSLQNGSYLQAINSFNKWSAQVEQSLGKEDQFEGFYLTSGLYNYLTSMATQKYKFLRLYTLFYLEGDKELGLMQLEKAFKSDHPIWKTEAAYFLMRIFLDTEENALAAQPYAQWLTTTYPNNLIFQYYYLQILMALGQNEAAAAHTNEIKRLANQNPNISADQRNYFIQLMENNGRMAH